METDESRERMQQRDQEALEDHERRKQEKANDNRARQVRQGVISDESEEEAPPEG